MRKYVKPSINVIELQLRENIAAVPTTIFKGSTKAAALATDGVLSQVDLTTNGTGLTERSDGLVVAS
jgi:hypothetical protein